MVLYDLEYLNKYKYIVIVLCMNNRPFADTKVAEKSVTNALKNVPNNRAS